MIKNNINSFKKTSVISFGKQSSQVVYDAKYLQLKSTRDNEGTDWFYSNRPGNKGVVIVAPISIKKNPETGKKEDYITFIETNRAALKAENIAKKCIELPGGLVGDIEKDEDLALAAKRELQEELGVDAEKMEVFKGNIASSPGSSSEVFSVAIASNLKQNKGAKDYDSGIVTGKKYTIPLKNSINWLFEQMKNGKAVSAQTFSALAIISNKVLNPSQNNDKNQFNYNV